MTSILENFIKAISDKYKISLNEAFEILSMFSILGRPLDEIYKEYWVAGTNDGGIDGIYIDEDTGNVHIFQSKNSKQLKQKDIQKFKSDYKNFFESGNTSNIEINEKIQAFIDEIKDFGEKGRILKPILYFCYSGENTDPPNAKIFKKFAKLVGNPPFFIKDSVLLIENLKSLQGIQRSSIVEFSFHPVSSEIYPGEQAIFSFYTQQIKAANFRISAIELCKLIDEEKSKNGTIDTLFSENIRGYLKVNKTNKKILETLLDSSKRSFFPFLNNGLTFICENMQIPAQPQVNIFLLSVKNPLIVNGQQTARMIYKIYTEKGEKTLDKVYLTVRAYETKENRLIDMITEATNTQTTINFRDQMSNKHFNHWARIMFASKKVTYIAKRGEILNPNPLEGELSESVANDTVLKFWYATYHEDPHTAKTSKSRVLESIFLATKEENPSLAKLFSGNPNSPVYSQLYNAYQIYKLVLEKRKIIESKKQTDLEYIFHADELICYGIYKKLQKKKKLKNLSSINIESLYEEVRSIINEVVKEEKVNLGEVYAHSKYFKSEGILEDYKLKAGIK